MKTKNTIIMLIGLAAPLFLMRNNSFAQEIIIGKQTWASVNLNVSTFRNGDPIPEAKTIGEWRKAGEARKPMFCYYNVDSKNGEKYGKLYNWYAVHDKRGLAPKGWHIPKEKEWLELVDFLGGDKQAGKKIKSISSWVTHEGYDAKYANGTNESGFNALPGGFKDFATDGLFNGGIGICGVWWCAEGTGNADYAIAASVGNWNDQVSVEASFRRYGYSVRCIKN